MLSCARDDYGSRGDVLIGSDAAWRCQTLVGELIGDVCDASSRELDGDPNGGTSADPCALQRASCA